MIHRIKVINLGLTYETSMTQANGILTVENEARQGCLDHMCLAASRGQKLPIWSR